MDIRARPSMVLAASRCLAVAVALEEAPFGPSRPVESRLLSLYSSLGPLTPDPTWDWVLKSLWYATVYGGLVLVHRCEPVVPISRVYVYERLSLGSVGRSRGLEDSELLRAWALIWSGAERDGLEELSGEAVWPEGYFWSPGGPLRVAFRGVVY